MALALYDDNSQVLMVTESSLEVHTRNTDNFDDPQRV